MTIPTDGAEVVDLTAESRFVIRLDGAEAELAYRLNGRRIVLIHTEVPATLEGHGLGGRLVRAALRRAAAEGLTVVPWCPFASDFLRRHPDDAAGVNVEWAEPADR